MQACAYLLDDFGGYEPLPLVELLVQVLHPLVQFSDVHVSQFGDILARDAEVERFLAQTLSLAHRAFHHPHLAFLFFLLPLDGVGRLLGTGCGLQHEFFLEVLLLTVYLLATHHRDITQSMAVRTRPLGRVEGEVVGGRFAVGNAAGRAHQVTAVVPCLAGIHIEDQHFAVSLLQGLCHAALQAAVILVADNEAVYDDLNVMVAVAIYLHARRHLLDGSIHPGIEESFALYGLEEFAVVSLAVLDQRCHEIDLATLIAFKEQFKELFLGVFHHALPRQVTVSLSRPCKEQAQVVIHLGRGAHGTPRVLVGGLLFDADDG